VSEGCTNPQNRFCRCHSVACPEGELGDVHVSTVRCRISRRFLEQMRQAGWAMEAPPASPSDNSDVEGGATGGTARASASYRQRHLLSCWPSALLVAITARGSSRARR